MKPIKHLILALSIALSAGLCTSAGAQVRKDTQQSAVVALDANTISLKLRSIEIAGGTTGFDYGASSAEVVLPPLQPRQILFGYSFLGRTVGDLPGSFALSMNCTPATFEPGGSNELVGGTWSLPVYVTGRLFGTTYVGALYGHVTGGKMVWDKTGATSTVDMNFTVDGGTQKLINSTGEGSFQGVLTESEKGATLDGVLTLTFK
jgi:hypothetical protein